MGHGILVLFPLSHSWGVGVERREGNCFCTAAHPSGTLPEGVGFASSYGASEKLLPAGRAKTCIWGEVGIVGFLYSPQSPIHLGENHLGEIHLIEIPNGFLSKGSPSGRERRRVSGKIQLNEVSLC